ncbi:hypothetical protein ACH0CP_12700 [Sphingomonas sp. 179-I 2A4 NHS]|uniref:hypothetical protein n=1 Tax=unclassified Sphingomonas TaxID=196159 RepID=UPI00387981AE
MTDARSYDPTDFYHNDLSALPTADRESLPQPTLSELWRAGVSLATDDRSNGERDRVSEAYRPILEVLNEGRPRRLWASDADDRHAYANPGQWAPAAEIGSHEREKEEALIWREIARRRQADPKFLPDVPGTLDEFHAKIVQGAQARRAAARDTLDRNTSTVGSVVSFAGGALKSLDDPLTVATLPIGGAGKTVAQRILIEGLVNAGAEAVQQPMLARRRSDLGEELTAGEAVTNVTAAGVVGSVLQGGVIEPAGALLNRFRRRVGSRATPAEISAAHVIEREDEVAATSPFQPGADGEEHVARLERARSVINGDPVAGAARPIVADPNARRNFKAHVRGAESSGNDAARPIDPSTGKLLSSALGRYQFTEGTWLSYYRRRFGSTESRDAILAKRTDGAVQDQLMDDLTADNAAALARIGAPETAGNLYLMHFLGADGGRKVLRASPDTPIAQVVDGAAIAANRRVLHGKTVGDVIDWAHQRMNEARPTTPQLRRELFRDEAEWSLAQAEVVAEDAALSRVRAEDEAQDARRFDTQRPNTSVVQRAEIDTVQQPRFESVVGALPSQGVAPAFLGKDGKVYVGSAMGNHFTAASEKLRAVGIEGTGFADNQGRFYNRQDALAYVNANGENIRPSDNMPGELDALDYREQSKFAALPPQEEFRASRILEQNEPVLERGRNPAPSNGGSPKPSAPKDLYRFLAEHGGLRDDEGHDLAGGRGLRTFVPGRGSLIRRGGMSLDRARELAAEAGYFHDTAPSNATSRTTVADFLDLLDEAQARPRYPLGSLEEVARREFEQAWKDEQAMRAAFDDAPALAGYDDPFAGTGPRSLVESLEHDLRMDVAADPNLTVRLSEDTGEQLVSDVLEDLDADAAALSAARRCMTPQARAA